MPASEGFAPFGDPGAGENHTERGVTLSVDEYEVIRLIDLEGLTQEQCAGRMEVARTTVTGIYDSARSKIADAIVNRRRLFIRGGNFRLCEGAGKGCGQSGCCHTNFITDRHIKTDKGD